MFQSFAVWIILVYLVFSKKLQDIFLLASIFHMITLNLEMC